MSTKTQAHLCAQIIQEKTSLKPKLGIVLGSGLSGLADAIEEAIVIPYSELPGFPKVSVSGHIGNLILGYLQGLPVVCLQGRAHFYEHKNHDAVITYIRTLKLLGCDYFLATNASGSLNPDFEPGSLMLVEDHINFQPLNPLLGPNEDEFGPRFPPMDNAYNKQLNEQIKTLAHTNQIELHQGIYVSVQGPSYETAAEIRMFRSFGADAVGMSTVPEVIVANHCRLKTAVVATMTNFATGLPGCIHDHDVVVEMANKNAKNLQALVKKLAEQLSHEFK